MKSLNRYIVESSSIVSKIKSIIPTLKELNKYNEYLFDDNDKIEVGKNLYITGVNAKLKTAVLYADVADTTAYIDFDFLSDETLNKILKAIS